MENLEKQRRTREKLQNALITLCGEKGYYQITIEDICRQAGTYRSTYYRYYDNKDALLREIEESYVQDTRNLTATVNRFRPDCTAQEMESYREELIRDMEYHRRHKKLCLFLLSNTGDPHFHRIMKQSLCRSISQGFLYAGKHLSAISAYEQNFFAEGYISTIREWLQKDDCSAERIAGFLLDMILRYTSVYKA